MVLGYALESQYELTIDLVETQRALRPAAALALGQASRTTQESAHLHRKALADHLAFLHCVGGHRRPVKEGIVYRFVYESILGSPVLTMLRKMERPTLRSFRRGHNTRCEGCTWYLSRMSSGSVVGLSHLHSQAEAVHG